MEKRPTGEPRDGSWTPFAVLAFLVSSILYGGAVWLVFGDWERSGSFGDSFGALTSIFTGLAFVAIVLSHRSQQRELRMATERHQLSIEAHKRAARILALSTMIASWQERVAVARKRGEDRHAEGLELEVERFVKQLREIADEDSWLSAPATSDE